MTKKIEDKAVRYLEIDRQMTELDKEKEEIRMDLLDAVDEKFPDQKRSATITVGEYNIKRISVAKIKWDLPLLKKLIGQSNYKDIIKVKESIDKASLKKISQKKEAGLIDKKDIVEASEVNYESRLKVKNKDENENEKEEQEDSFIVDMDY